MSALGQKQTSAHVRVMSALPPKADIETQSRNVRCVPEGGIESMALAASGLTPSLIAADPWVSTKPEGAPMQTALCKRLGIELPIIQAPMGGAVGPPLAAAVSNAGGLGMLVPWRADIDTVRRQIREMRALTARPFGVNLVLEFPQEERLAVCLDERVPVISFFWRDPSSLVPLAPAHDLFGRRVALPRALFGP